MRAAPRPAFVARAWPLLGLTLALRLGSGERGGARFEILLTPWREASAPAPLRLARAG